MKSPVLACFFIFLSALARADVNCETSKVAFVLPSSTSPTCRSLKLTGIHTVKLCDNKRGNLTTADGRNYFLFANKNLWMFQEEQQNSSSLESETLTMDFERKSFSYTAEKSNSNGTVLKKTVCNGIFEIKN